MSKYFAEKLKLLRKEKGISQEEFGKKFNITKTGVSYWENNKSEPSIEMIKRISEYFDVPIEFLLGDNSNKEHVSVKMPYPISIISINIYDSISCGNGGFVEDNIIDTITLPTDMFKNLNKDYFGQYAKGDSMIESGINDGDLLIFEKTTAINVGEVGCFCVDDNIATCKKYSITEDNIIYLMPSNSNYPPIRIDVNNTSFKIIGKLSIKITKQ